MKILFSVLLCVVASSAWSEAVRTYERLEHRFSVAPEYDNPFHAESVRVDAVVALPEGGEVTVPCFYDGEGEWVLRYAPTQAGEHRFTITAVTPSETETVSQGVFTARENDARGYVRIGENPRHFAFENGESYFPLGQNLGWVWGGSLEQWREYLHECEAAGMNWIRIWMCPWGMTELTWTPFHGRYAGMDTYELENARLLDAILEEAERRGLYIQWVIHHHGQYSIDHNPEWQNNPFNEANGGFLRAPEEFFTSEEAKRHYRNRLRYLVARWGYSPNVMAWEFWNEVDLTHNFDPEAVTAWHDEMSAYLKQIDPTKRLHTTSTSYHDFAVGIERLDFLQSHAYRTDIIDGQQKMASAMLANAPERPHFSGELSYDWRGPNTDDTTGIILHNQLWSSVHSADSGTAMTWWWDNWVHPNDLYYHFRPVADYIDGIDWNGEPLLPMPALIGENPANQGTMTFTPPVGWWETSAETFEIGVDGTIEPLDRMSTFIHGENHREMAPNPTFILNAAFPATFGVRLERVSASGAELEIRVNDGQIVRRVFEPTQDDSTIRDNADIEIPVVSGENRISLRNTGRDWIEVRHYWVDGFIQRPRAFARGNDELVLVWVQDRAHQFAVIDRYAEQSPLQPTTLTLPSLPPGEYTVERFDPYRGDRSPAGTFPADSNGLIVPLPAFERDTAFRIQRVGVATDSSTSTRP